MGLFKPHSLPHPFLHVGVIVGWLGYLLLLRTVAPHVVAREWGIRANGGFNCEVLLIAEEYSITTNKAPHSNYTYSSAIVSSTSQ